MDIPILIVGAGPTGLMMACELARHGVPFRIIDKQPEPTAFSNATWIQTLTIEVFDHIELADRFIEISNPCHAINLYIDGKHLTNIPLNQINSIYPFILILPQSQTETLLLKRLAEFNKKVERPLEFIDAKKNKHSIISTLKGQNGHTETITSQWLIACDGANSTVREKCNIFFKGEDLPDQFIVADAEIESFMSKKEIHVFFDEGTVFAAFPLGENKYRITANLHLPYPRKLFTEREVIEMAQERAHGAYYIKSVSWISPFWIHGKVVKQMRHGSIFLAGDAAHIHSPAGGQGMNTGLQDAYNLAWKLAFVIKNKAKPSLLNSYHSERHPIVSKIVRETDYYTKLAIQDRFFLKKIRKFSNNLSHSKLKLANKIGTEITQLSIRYQKSPIIHYKNTSSKFPKPGEHAPDVVINKTARLYHYLRNALHHCLIFTGAKISKTKLEKIIELKNGLDKAYPDQIKTYIISKETVSNDIILDKEGSIHGRYGIKTPSVYILRPDNYIAYCSKNLDKRFIQRFLKKYLLL